MAGISRGLATILPAIWEVVYLFLAVPAAYRKSPAFALVIMLTASHPELRHHRQLAL